MRNVLLVVFIFMALAVSGQIENSAKSVSPLEAGKQIPDVSIKDLDNNKVMVRDIVAEGPAVFLFYRGGWCPYCTKHLSDIASIEGKIKKMGYTIVAISPDSPDKMKETLEKSDITYKLYSDSDGELIKSMGLAFKAPKLYGRLLKKHSDGINKGVLPVPALYVVGTDGNIKYRFYSSNYKERISSDELLKELSKL
jgi:peroxiredoxin